MNIVYLVGQQTRGGEASKLMSDNKRIHKYQLTAGNFEENFQKVSKIWNANGILSSPKGWRMRNKQVIFGDVDEVSKKMMR